MNQTKNILFLFYLLLLSCNEKGTEVVLKDNRDILTKLNDIKGLIATEIPSSDHFNRIFEIYITQPVDHDNPDGESFQQKVYLGHVGEEIPVALETEGYSRNSFKLRDISKLLNCNQISIEHRFNGESIPTPTDWQFLTIEQSANDVHRIVTKLKSIYSNGWISSGRSKGGEAAIFHRRFFPDDVDATVAIVAPILFSTDDARIKEYLSNAGDINCQKKIKDFQQNALLKLDSLASIIPSFTTWVNNNYNTSFTFSLSNEMIIKYAVIDYPFEFWSSSSHDCSSIPSNSMNAQEIFDHIVEVVDILLFYTDYGIDFWRAWYYQAQTEIGDYTIETKHVDDLLGDLEELSNVYDFEVNLNFNTNVMQDIDNWTRTEGDQIIYIYGEDDPWTAAQFEISGLDVVKIINPGTKHETSIFDLSMTDQTLIKDKLSQWINWTIE